MVRQLILTEQEAARLRGFFPQILSFLTSDLAYRARASQNVLREIPFSLSVTAQEVGIADSQEKIMVQGIIDLVFEEQGKWILVDYKSNMAEESRAHRPGQRLSDADRSLPQGAHPHHGKARGRKLSISAAGAYGAANVLGGFYENQVSG